MSEELKRFNEFVDWFWELVFGTERRPKKEKDIGQYIGLKRPKRARTKKGTYKADDPTTKDYNEAYVGGKAPKDLLGLKKRKK